MLFHRPPSLCNSFAINVADGLDKYTGAIVQGTCQDFSCNVICLEKVSGREIKM